VTGLGIFNDALTLPEHHTGDLGMEALGMRNKACALRDLGRHIEAIEVCDSAARLHPDSFVKSVELRADMWEEIGHYPNAAEVVSNFALT